MITKEHKDKIIKVLGFRYSTIVRNDLKLLKIKNKDGKDYSADMVRQVMNGLANDNVETAIISAVEKKSTEIKRRKRILKQL